MVEQDEERAHPRQADNETHRQFDRLLVAQRELQQAQRRLEFLQFLVSSGRISDAERE